MNQRARLSLGQRSPNLKVISGHTHRHTRHPTDCSTWTTKLVGKNGLTRVLAIDVSIPNLTVARLEQFRSPQLRIQREQPTDVGIDW